MGFFDFFKTKSKITPDISESKITPDISKKGVSKPVSGGRQTRPTIKSSIQDLKKGTIFVNPDFITEYIPIIRKISWINPDVGLALNDMVRLSNTGHRITFDPGVTPEQQEEMKYYLGQKQKTWGDGLDGMHGIVNKLFAQIWISGALSNEWVIKNDKTGISNVALVNPETIRWSWNRKKLRFQPYQKQNFETGGKVMEKMVKLNELTYKYFAINGDTEMPYAIPPFLTALNSLTTQGDMDQNIRFIMKQIGLLGFFEMLMTKPHQADGENEAQYNTRLSNLLSDSKDNIKDGIGEGLVVGFKDDHEFNFNSTTKNLGGVADIYNQNERSVANGLKTPPEFMGIPSSGAETGINIIFTKMLSQLQNAQIIIANNLQYGYSLELRLAGFNFKYLKVEFDPSTIADDLKYQQGQEYKIRNVFNKYQAGYIGQQAAAVEMGYDKPDQSEPRGPLLGQSTTDSDEDTKNDSARKGRDKKKPQPKRKDQKKSNNDLINDLLERLAEE